jgi:phospholipase/carboxylesterase
MPEAGPYRRIAARFAWAATVLYAAIVWGAHGPAARREPPMVSDAEARRGVQYREHRIEGLRVLEVVVGHADFEARLPLVMQLHGRGDRARLPEGAYDNVSSPLRILIPEAPAPLGLGFTWAPVSVTAHKPMLLGAALAREATRLTRVLRHIEGIREVDGRPIVTGFSQGAMLSYTLAVRHPEAVGAALPVSGWIPPHLVPRRPRGDVRVPILALHGTADPIVKIGPTRVAVRRLRHLGYDVHLDEFPGVEHEMTAAMRRRHHELLRQVLEVVASGAGPSA